MNPKNRRLRRSVAAAGISLLGIGVAASYLILGASAPARAAEGTTHLLMIELADDSGSVLVEGTNDSPAGPDLSKGFCVTGPLPKGWLKTPYLLRNGSEVKAHVFGSPHCTDQLLQELEGTVPGDDGLFDYRLTDSPTIG